MEPLADLMGRLLDRTLSGQEKEMLEFLSPQGVAKLNADICKGYNLEHTMIDLLDVFQASQRRRIRVESWVSPGAQSILSRLNRPPTTDELGMLADVPATVVTAKLSEQVRNGEAIEDILEELAIGHRQKLLMCDAQQTATQLGKPVTISRLVATAAPTRTANKILGMTLSMVSAPVSLPLIPPQKDLPWGSPSPVFDGLVTPRRRQSVRLGLSPVVTWFADSPRTINEISFDVDTVARSPLSCPTSPEGSFRGSARRRESLPATSNPLCRGSPLCSAFKTARRPLSPSTIRPFSQLNFNESVVSIGLSDDSATETNSAESIAKDRAVWGVGISALNNEEVIPTFLSPTQTRVSFAATIKLCPLAKDETPRARRFGGCSDGPSPPRRLLAFLAQALVSCKPKLKSHKASAVAAVSE